MRRELHEILDSFTEVELENLAHSHYDEIFGVLNEAVVCYSALQVEQTRRQFQQMRLDSSSSSNVGMLSR